MNWTSLTLSFALAAVLSPIISVAAPATEQFVRFEHQNIIHYGKLYGDEISILSGDIFGDYIEEKERVLRKEVALLLPTDPEKVFAVGMNFASHLASAGDQPPPMFLKLPSSLIGSGEVIHAPDGATNVHFEGELVIVIGKEAKNLSLEQASDAIFGVTVGNDLTERNWQGRDLQWMRGKAADGFGPIAYTITRGVDYENVLLTTRLNGKIVQQENTRNMIHSSSKVVSYLSQYFTLKPGDLIFMGTPGRTKALNDGDVVSVEIDGVGLVENRIQF